MVSVLIMVAIVTITPSNADTGNNCDSSYPTVCIAPPPPDLDCKDIPHRNFQVQSPDPHKFDDDEDGIGCEKK
ncbi:MAG TPA: hypothetical protein DEG17_19755 [Cyanobacteria bacterium UBA11149]|nr:hypothetical protein [Cyanobacteria bacterium UBA11367]HBE61050.1 hypothetical protein [Cyanobacteria bacterium UBA11366]HBK62286.1 hypothetical protein [Cyanobacteria bacterium UBA11166]HBR74236.1 hypothetical protein [Cyanobacteria bacterium UBA11159]HBS69867.1 hypothetical protein [Cyanobacteria bacterium UBA11153]HBW91035.1 hypothetical protein [Cyanobacteria bacterium UBA11149]HCA95032.1 hypothetical protein [Cyanobacteria bacterium UBA9226]